MAASDQTAFIDTVRKALGRSEADVRARRGRLFDQPMSDEAGRILNTLRLRSPAERKQLLESLCAQARALNMNITVVENPTAAAQAIAAQVAASAPEWGPQKSVVRWDHPLLNELNLEELLARQKVPVSVTHLDENKDPAEQRGKIRRQITEAYIGITAVDFCLADTATLVMKTRPHQARAVSLVPAIHVAVARLDQLLADLKELYALLRWDARQQQEGLSHHMVMITGPSKTGDIELVMVHGAHGPREVHLIVITGD